MKNAPWALLTLLMGSVCPHAMAAQNEDQRICAEIRRATIHGQLPFLSPTGESENTLDYAYDYSGDGKKDLLKIDVRYPNAQIYTLITRGNKFEEELEYFKRGRPAKFAGHYYIVSGQARTGRGILLYAFSAIRISANGFHVVCADDWLANGPPDLS